MTLVLDTTEVASALGEAIVCESPSNRVFFQYLFEAAVNSAGKANLSFGLSLRPEDATNADLQKATISPSSYRHDIAIQGVNFDSEAIRFVAADYPVARGIFYLENLPQIIVPTVAGLVISTPWRLRLWAWGG